MIATAKIGQVHDSSYCGRKRYMTLQPTLLEKQAKLFVHILIYTPINVHTYYTPKLYVHTYLYKHQSYMFTHLYTPKLHVHTYIHTETICTHTRIYTSKLYVHSYLYIYTKIICMHTRARVEKKMNKGAALLYVNSIKILMKYYKQLTMCICSCKCECT